MKKVVFNTKADKKVKKDISSLDRLISILTKLSNDEKPTAKELSREFGVSVRTIQKDINERLISFPIYKDDKHRYSFTYGFSLNKTLLEQNEMILLQLISKTYQFLNSKYLISP